MNTDLAKLEESDAGKAQRLVGELLREAGWMEGKLKHRPKGEIKKAPNSDVGLWIAKRLEMGHWRTAADAVRAA